MDSEDRRMLGNIFSSRLRWFLKPLYSGNASEIPHVTVAESVYVKISSLRDWS